MEPEACFLSPRVRASTEGSSKRQESRSALGVWDLGPPAWLEAAWVSENWGGSVFCFGSGEVSETQRAADCFTFTSP